MKKIQVIDLFCGAGGLSWGFSVNADPASPFELIGAVDHNRDSLVTYSRNITCKVVLEEDLAAVGRTKENLQQFISKFVIDRSRPLIVIGGPPCQGFSAHSKKHRRVDDVRNDLVTAFARIATALKPDLVAFENVPEAMTEKNWQHFRPMVTIFKQGGFHMSADVHNLADYGVPQDRFRTLFVATKKALPRLTATHQPGGYVTVRNAIGHLPTVCPGVVGEDPMHFCANHRKSTIETIKLVAHDGGSRPAGVGPKCLAKVDGYRDVYGRLAWDRPAVTITGSARNPASGRFSHPVQDRGLTVREAALLQGFPPDYFFEGSFDDKFTQIGNAVPPRFSVVLAKAISESLQHPRNTTNKRAAPVPLRNSFSSALFAFKRSSEEVYEGA